MEPAPAQNLQAASEGSLWPQNVCAVVVTYNRKTLLEECVWALEAQTCPVAKTVVIDNASSDGTIEMLESLFPHLEILSLSENVGGAGGFHVGMKWAYEHGYDWLWVLDDDTIATPTALEELFLARARFPEEKQPQLLVSKVVWTDGSLHTMNQPLPHFADLDGLSRSVERATLSIRSTTFVSCLLHRDLVMRYGLPVADYFIWGDDTEYTARILRENLGVVVPRSVAVHKTARQHTALDAAPERFTLHVRNTIWMLTHSAAYSGKEKLRNAVTLVTWIVRYLKINQFNFPAVRGVLAGLQKGLFSSPRERDLGALVKSRRAHSSSAAA